MEDKEYIFTFGAGQAHANKYYVISAPDAATAASRMREVFGIKWSMQYCPPLAREKAGVDQFNLTELK